jgi:hypothetical protein
VKRRSRTLQTLSGSHRALAALAAASAFIVMSLAGASALSALYSSRAFDLLRLPGGQAAGAAAAQQAAVLAPWRAVAQMRLAEAGLVARAPDLALQAVERRLQLAPADAYAWLQLASVHRMAGRFDARLTQAYEVALRRAPGAAALDYLLALDGVRDWRFGDAQQRAIWLGATERTLLNDRRSLLRQIVQWHREGAFCAYAVPELPELSAWCEDARRLRQACAASGLRPDQAAWCANAGFATVDPHAQ